MQSLLKHFWLSGIAILSLPVMTAVAAPLSAGTMLGITQGVGSAPNLSCASGSCFSMELAPGFVVWTDFGPGTDGGFIVGKAQKCGGQELGPSSGNTTPGELTNAWLFFGNYGTFCTDPGGEQNIFDDAPCAGAACIGKTELKYFYAAWNGTKVPLGSVSGCVHPNCSPAQTSGTFISDYQINPVTGGAWSMKFGQVVSSGQFLGVRFSLVTRGLVTPVTIVQPNTPPTAQDILLENVNMYGVYGTFVSDADGDPLSCRIGTPPRMATAFVAPNCSFVSIDFIPLYPGATEIFSYLANDGTTDSLPGVVIASAVNYIYCPLSWTPHTLPRMSITIAKDTPVAWDFSSSGDSLVGSEAYCHFGIVPTFGGVVLNPDQRCAGRYTPNPGYVGADKFVYGFYYSVRVSPPGHIPVETCSGTAYGIVDVTVTPAIPVNVQADAVTVSVVSQELISWKPTVTSNVTTPLATCTLKTPPQNGTATVASDCSTGSYQSFAGFVGTDSFVYEASVCTDQCYRSAATVTVAVTEPSPSDLCQKQYPVSRFTQTGKEGTLKISFTGNITSHTNKEVKVCPGTALDYQASSTKDMVKCKIKNSLTSGSGTLQIRDHLKCTDKPGGKDKVQYKVKSGITK